MISDEILSLNIACPCGAVQRTQNRGLTVVEAALGKLAVEKPQPEQVVASLLTEQPFAADGVD